MTGSGCLQGRLSASSWPFITRPPLWSQHAAAAAAAARTLCPGPHLNPSLPDINGTFAATEIVLLCIGSGKALLFLLVCDLLQSFATIIVGN